MLRSAARPTGAVYTAVIGGAVFLALTAAGLAAEVAVPAAIVRFDDLAVIGLFMLAIPPVVRVESVGA